MNKRLISILMALVMIVLSIPETIVYAGTSISNAEKTITLFSRNNVATGENLLTWKGLTIVDFAPCFVEYVGDDGNTYPAYCINPNKPGVEGSYTYKVDVDVVASWPRVWGVLTNGYPYKTPAELGVNNEYEAYYITKMAMWAAVHDNYSNLNDWKANGSHRSHVETAMKNLHAVGMAVTEIPETTLTATPVTTVAEKKNNGYLEQVFTVESNVGIKEYTVSFADTPPTGTIISDMWENEQSTFAEGAQFKVKIPITDTERVGTFNLNISGEIINKSILYGQSHSDSKQDYAVTPEMYTYKGIVATASYQEGEGTTPDPDPDPDPDPTPTPTPQSGKIQILKLEQGTTNGLSGAVFRITDAQNGIIGDYVTDGSGQVTIPIETGVYYVDELKAPDGYLLSENNHKDITVTNLDEPAVLTFANYKMPSLEVQKIDADTGKNLSGAAVRIALDGGSDFYDAVTDGSGFARFTNLQPGAYQVVELSAPSGYILDSTPVTVKLEPGKTGTVVLTNKEKPGLKITKYDEGTGFPLENAEFSVATMGGSIVWEGMTAKDGTIKLEGLEAGWYKITELAPPPGYIITDGSKDVFLEEGKVVEVKFDNRKKPSLQIMKIDEETSEHLEGAVFHVRKTEGGTVSEYVTDYTGTIIIDDLDEGIFTISEIVAPDGYLLDQEHKDVLLEWGKTTTVIFTNKARPKLEILKVDSITQNPIKDVIFKVTKTEDKTVSEYTTDEHGRILIENLDEAIYTVEEVFVPNDYILDTQHKEIALEWGKTKTLIYENTKKPTLVITKTNGLTYTPIPNTTYKIEYEDINGGVKTIGTYRTNKEGQIVLSPVDVGWYQITETVPAQGYSLPSNPVTRKYLSAGENTYTILGDDSASQNGLAVTNGNDYIIGQEIIDYPLNSIVIKKSNIVNGELLGGATFELRKVSEDISGNSGTIIGRYTTNHSGIIVITGLEPGGYIVEEVQAPTNFLLNENNQQQAWLKADGTSIVEVAFSNIPYGSILITKQDSQSLKPLANVKFQVTDGNGAVVGNSNGIYYTDINGEILIANVPPGAYVVREIETIPGYAITDEPQTITVGQDGGTYKVSFINAPLGSLVLRKWNSADNSPLAGAEFLVKYSDGTVIGDNNGIFKSDQQGTIVIDDVYGSIVVQEIKAPENFVLEQQTETIFIDYGQTKTLDFYNRPMSGLTVWKYDSDKQPLSGVRFKLIKKSGEIVGEYTTNFEGYFNVDNLEPGWYSCYEVWVDDAYILDSTPQDFEITANQSITLQYFNHKKSDLIVRKFDENKNPQAGAVFRLMKKSGEIVEDFAIGGDGYYTISALEPGWYSCFEVQSLPEYELNGESQDFEVTHDQMITLNFYNQLKGSIIIKKTDEKTGLPLSSVLFSVERQTGEYVGDFETDNDGTILIPSLDAGYYLVREKRTKAGYILDETPKTVRVKENTPTVVNFTNREMSGLIAWKYDQDGQILPGAKMRVVKKSGEIVGTYTIGQQGFFTIEHLEPGWYSCFEVEGVDGYLMDSTPQDFEVTSNQLVTLEFYNKKMSGLLVRKYSLPDKQPLGGSIFRVTKKSGELVGDFEVNPEGYFNVDKLEPGWYSCFELSSPEGFELNAIPQDFQITNNQLVTLNFYNERLSGLKLYKYNRVDRQPISDVLFSLSKMNGEHLLNFKTLEDGTFYVDNLEPGWYTLTELQQKEGFLLDQSPINFEIKYGEPVLIEVPNTPISNLLIIKTDSQSREPIKGVSYEVKKENGEIVATEKTDKDGRIYLGLPAGKYYVSEKQAQTGYVLDTEVHEIVVLEGQQALLELQNTKQGGLLIIKTDSQTHEPLEYVSFEVKKESGEIIGTYRTDKDGRIYLNDLPEGKYLVSEKQALDGYVQDTRVHEVNVKEGKQALLELENTKQGGLLIIKTDSQSHEPLEYVSFEVKKESGEIVGTYKTDKDGRIYLNDLPEGKYLVSEKQALDGYIIDERVHEITVHEGKQALLELENTKQGGLLLIKTDMNTKKPLEGVSYDIAKINGEKVGRYQTDRNGQIYINDLPDGKYTAVEVEALSGYELDTTMYEFEIQSGQQTKIYLQNKQLSGLRLLKIDSITKEPIYNVEFMVFDTNGKVVGTFYTDNNGVIDFSALLVEGRYTLRETRPASGYYNDDVPRTIELVSGKYTEITWENIPEAGQIQIYKVSADANETNGLPAGTPLEGAIFEVYSQKSGNLVDRFITGSDGRGVSKALPLGRYLVKEVQAPTYYQLNSKELDVTIEFATQIVKLEFSNISANTGVSINKVAPAETTPGQQIRYDIKNARNDSSIPLSDFYIRDILPVDAVRIDKIVTGSYNQSLKYKITAITNKGNTIVIADNLKTAQNNVIDCSNAALGLASDEFVTQFTFYFGNVQAGFAMVEEINVFATVLNRSLPNGYRFANKVDIGGTNQGEWVIGNSTASTIVYVPTPAVLPKTGN